MSEGYIPEEGDELMDYIVKKQIKTQREKEKRERENEEESKKLFWVWLIFLLICCIYFWVQ
tara:strand:- start:46 stop:228 length:183 start_codon:yes stop_codon:yes gene_type:complete